MLVLVAGASGELGRRVVAEVLRRGHRVRALGRHRARLAATGAEELHIADAARPDSFADACADVDVVISCLGASVALKLTLPDRGYRAVDLAGNARLIDEAERAGVRRFVYVSMAGAQQMRGLEYVDAHEEVVERLAASALDHVVLRPTGFFSALAPLMYMARFGIPAVVGPGTARSNPIDDDELAHACADAIDGAPGEIELGGPDVLTRDAMMEAALMACARDRRIIHIPTWFLSVAAFCLKPLLPRLSALLSFVAAVMTIDVVAPPGGERRLVHHFRHLARRQRPTTTSPVFSEDASPPAADAASPGPPDHPRRNTAQPGDESRV